MLLLKRRPGKAQGLLPGTEESLGCARERGESHLRLPAGSAVLASCRGEAWSPLARGQAPGGSRESLLPEIPCISHHQEIPFDEMLLRPLQCVRQGALALAAGFFRFYLLPLSPSAPSLPQSSQANRQQCY